MSSTDTTLDIAVDIGGTFTDVALREGKSGRVWRAKTPSTPSDPSEAFLDGLTRALETADLNPSGLSTVFHGTTVATNIILEGKGAKAALVTTRGFRHLLAIGRQDIPRRANLYTWRKPERPVPSHRIVEIDERIAPGGSVHAALDEASVVRAAEELARMKVEAVAVCLLHAFANPEHERRTAEILKAHLPNVAITTSTNVLPVMREYERSLAAVLNAIVMPGIATYVSRLEERLDKAGVKAPLLLMQSNGGVAGAAKIRSAPALTALSGPAAGVVGALAEARQAGIEDILTVDIGGTSADVSLIRGGEIALTQAGQVGEWPLPLPMVDIITLGAGGGSIASVNDGALKVGPQSAGAVPGPAAYGRGGTEPTVTDAHVVLGHLPEQLLGGRMALDTDAAVKAVSERVASPLGLTVEDAARGILAIADNHMVGALRVLSVERGFDPRDFTLVPFGGAGPLHGCALAELLGVRRVLIPRAPGVLCADGLLEADLKAQFSQALPVVLPVTDADVQGLLDKLEIQAKDWLDAEAVPESRRHTKGMALMRYRGQGAELAVPWTADQADLAARFAEAHKALYGFTLDAVIELVTVRVDAVGEAAPTDPQPVPEGAEVTPIGHTELLLPEGPLSAPIFDRDSLGVETVIEGPAILSQLDTTTLLPSGWRARIDPLGALLLEREDDAA
ncbi:MAG: hydantoinase/oxoprolinase family protein [Pseudomonadota bacterium]